MKEVKINTKLKRALLLKACDYCLDLSKVILAGVVLASIMDLDINRFVVLGCGVAVVLILALLGFLLYVLGNQRKL